MECRAEAFLHGDVWPFWYNYRVQCDKEHKGYWRCTKQQGTDCTKQKAAWEGCDVCKVIDGVCIPRSWAGETDGCCAESACCNYTGPDAGDGQDTYFFGYWSSCRTDCDTRDYDYESLWGHFYGKTWDRLGPWSISFSPAALKEGKKGEDESSGVHADWKEGLGFFGCYQLPTGNPITVSVKLHDWGTQDAPLQQTFTPEPGKHYVWGLNGVQEWDAWDRGPCIGPPQRIYDRLGKAADGTEGDYPTCGGAL